MQVRRLDFASGFGDLIPAWDELLGQARRPNVFMTRSWLQHWSNHLGAAHDAWVLAVHDDEGRLAGAAALVLIERGYLGLRELTFMGTGAAGADHLDFISSRGEEAAVTDAICRYLRAHSDQWDVLRLTDLPRDSTTPLALQRHFNDDFVHRQTAGAACPYLPLAGSWQTYLERQSRNFRQQTRSKRRQFEQLSHSRFVACDKPAEVERAMQCLFRFNPERWNARGDGSAFADQKFQDFHLDIAGQFLSQGWLDLYYLEIENQIAAVIYGFAYLNRIYFYNSGFDPRWSKYSLGRVLMAYHVQSAFERGFDEYDFLRGNHSYKYAWTTTQRRNLDVMILRRSPKTLARYRVNRGLHLARRTVKRHLPHILRHGLKTVPSSA